MNKIVNINDNFEKLKDFLKHRLEWEKLILKISTGFINVPGDKIDAQINSSLAKLGSFMDVDRCYVFEISAGRGIMNNTYEWCRDGVSPQIERNQRIAIDPQSFWMKRLFSLEVNHVPSVGSLPPHAVSERQVMEIEAIKSLVAVPLAGAEGPSGFIGFDMIRHEKSWSDEDITMLKIFAEIVTNALNKKNMEMELIKARDEAETANRHKSQFLANMSHEIRTPLNGILGFAKLLETSELSALQKETVGFIHKSGKHLLSLINDILDFSKIESNMIEIEKTEFCFNSLVDDIINLNLISASNKNIELICRADKKFDACLIGDPSRLKQILFNLVDNAVKFTEKGSVTLECKTHYENAERVAIEISVTDTGIGIPPDRLKEIFKPFTQADGSITRKYGGTGLGLTICNKLICLMGGHGLMVESVPGAGSRFYFYMHFAKAECTENFRPRTFSTPADALCGPAVDPQSIRVLVAEDDPVNAFLMTRFLEMLNYKFKIVANGLEAIEESKNSSYDIIFMDVHMSELNGIEAAAKIREFDKTIPIIACTADTARDDIDACLEAGMQSYIFKPFELNDIIQSINTFIRPE